MRGTLASQITNGWQITGINSWQSGFRFTVYSGMDNSGTGVGSDRADFTGSNINQAIFGDRSHAQMVNQYFDTSLSDFRRAFDSRLSNSAWRCRVASAGSVPALRSVLSIK
jgi:hemolysin activation/secretion protein